MTAQFQSITVTRLNNPIIRRQLQPVDCGINDLTSLFLTIAVICLNILINSANRSMRHAFVIVL